MQNKIKNDFVSIQTKLAGVSFGDCQTNIRKWGCPDIGWYGLYREPDNKYDPNAVFVALFGVHKMGYLSKEIAAKIAPLMDGDRYFLAQFVRINEFPEITNTIGLTVRIVETTGQ